jgi:hypothetical protein
MLHFKHPPRETGILYCWYTFGESIDHNLHTSLNPILDCDISIPRRLSIADSFKIQDTVPFY